MSTDKLTTFEFRNTSSNVRFVETQQVKTGVECDIYEFVHDSTKDLAVVRVKMGHKTPLQRVLKGDQTVEIYADGAGRLSVLSREGVEEAYIFTQGDLHQGQVVQVGEKMQWIADDDHDLTFYEVCTPPYQDGRFEDLV